VKEVKLNSYNKYILVFSIAFICYFNSIFNKYVFDDSGLVIRNSITEKGISAITDIFSSGYRSSYTHVDHEFYRPIPKFLHALEWEFFPYNPHAAHLIQVLLFSILCVTIYHTFKKYNAYAFAGSILFALHPIHTEVVASIKGADELLATILGLLSLQFFLSQKYSWSLCVLTLSFFCKESAILWFPINLVAGHFLVPLERRKIILYVLLGGAIALSYILLRQHILSGGNLSTTSDTNPLVLLNSVAEQKANALWLFIIQFSRLFVPIFLCTDISYQGIDFIKSISIESFISVLFYVSILYLAIRGLITKNKLLFPFTFILISTSLTSNIIFLAGTNYAERLWFVPSIVFCLWLPMLVMHLYNRMPKKDSTHSGFNYAFIAICFVFAALTFIRNNEWKNNYTLFSVDVTTYPNTARLHCYYAAALSDPIYLKGLSNQDQIESVKNAIKSFEEAVRINPNLDDAWESVGSLYLNVNQFDAAEQSFKKAILLDDNKASYYNNLGN